jgi:hypothetical protein
MTLDELGKIIRDNRLIFLSIARTPDGGWQASSRVDGSAGFATYCTKGDETLDYAVGRVVPGLFLMAEKPAAAVEDDIFA